MNTVHALNFSLQTTDIVALLVVLALLVGVSFYLGRRRGVRARAKARRLPGKWPLMGRRLLNSNEARIWGWLQGVFPDYHIMVKLPVTRFTAQRQRGAASEWFQMLNGVYCTFTICDTLGQAIGCVDVPGAQGIPERNRQIKQTLLAQCGMTYLALSSGKELPESAALRARFLDAYWGADAQPPENAQDYSDSVQGRFQETAMQLHMALDRNRRSIRTTRPGLLDDFVATREAWGQPDSFLGKLDSRGRLIEEEALPRGRPIKLAANG
jgi:hypothetical protein